jgi:hypothetical protein
MGNCLPCLRKKQTLNLYGSEPAPHPHYYVRQGSRENWNTRNDQTSCDQTVVTNL